MAARLTESWGFQALLVAAILIPGCWLLFFAGGGFDRAHWLNADPESRTRAVMVDDLLARYRLVGRSRFQIVSLLGPPTPGPRWREWDLAYVLGPHAGAASDGSERHDWLLIDLDDRDVVIRTRVTGE